MNLSENITNYISKLENSEVSFKPDFQSKNWNFVPVQHELLAHLYQIYKDGFKFIDLGCGIGNVLEFAHNIGYDVLGVENNPDYLKYNNFKVLQQDIKSLEPDFYKQFDVIYCYLPLKDEMEHYINYVVESMKLNSYIVTPLLSLDNPKLKSVDWFYYQKES